MDYLPIFIRKDEIRHFPADADHVIQAMVGKSMLEKMHGFCCDDITAIFTGVDQGPGSGCKDRFLHHVLIRFEGFDDDYDYVFEKIYGKTEAEYIVIFPVDDKFVQLIGARLGRKEGGVRITMTGDLPKRILCEYSFTFMYPTMPNFPADVTVEKVTARQLMDYLYKKTHHKGTDPV